MALAVIVSDALLNLDILGSITINQTLMVDGDRLRFDTRYAQWFRRSVSGDSRQQIQNAIEKTFTIFEELLHSYQCNIHIIQPDTPNMKHEQAMIVTRIADTLKSICARKTKVIEGLDKLSTFERYSGDSEFKIQMTRFGDRMQNISKWAEKLLGIIDKNSGADEE